MKNTPFALISGIKLPHLPTLAIGSPFWTGIELTGRTPMAPVCKSLMRTTPKT